jgi:hypothetical protein
MVASTLLAHSIPQRRNASECTAASGNLKLHPNSEGDLDRSFELKKSYIHLVFFLPPVKFFPLRLAAPVCRAAGFEHSCPLCGWV